MPNRRNKASSSSHKRIIGPNTDQGSRRVRARMESWNNTNDQPNVTPEKKEKKRRPKWTLYSTIKEVLFEGHDHTADIKLKDFLQRELGYNNVVTKKNPSMKAFVMEPGKYIDKEETLKNIMDSPSYQTYALLTKCVSDLRDNAVLTLREWSEATEEVKETVTETMKRILDDALVTAYLSGVMSGLETQDGLYESVYDAKWSHVVEVPDDCSGGDGMRMEAREGIPPQESWKYKVKGWSLEVDDAIEQFRSPRPRLTVLTSEKNWPYSLCTGNNIIDCFVNVEVERVWRIVEGDLTGLFDTQESEEFEVRRRVLIGTEAIGKSAAAGSYLLYQLLHFDIGQIPVVVYYDMSSAYVFDKNTETVMYLRGDGELRNILNDMSLRGIRGYIIQDVRVSDELPSLKLPPTGWGMTLISAPYEKRFKGWEEKKGALRIVMNCPGERDLRAMYAWMKHNECAREQGDDWNIVKEHITPIGPITRFVFDRDYAHTPMRYVWGGVHNINPSNVERYLQVNKASLWYGENPFHDVVKTVRLVTEHDGIEYFWNAPISAVLRGTVLSSLAKAIMLSPRALHSVLEFSNLPFASSLEVYGVCAFMNTNFVEGMHDKFIELMPPAGREPHFCVLQMNPQLCPKDSAPLFPKMFHPKKSKVCCGVLYVLGLRSSPPFLDGFFFIKAPQKKLVGIRTSPVKPHDITTRMLKEFNEDLVECFEKWEAFAQGLTWEIIFLQHVDSELIEKWLNCEVSKHTTVDENEEESTVEFWGNKVRQYVLNVSCEDVSGVCGE